MDEASEIAAALAGSALFGEVSSEAREALAGIARTLVLPPDSFIVCQGDPRMNGYLIASGAVRLLRADGAGREYELAQLAEGESFEEAALLTDEPTSLSAKTIGQTRLVVIPRDRFGPIITRHPDAVSAVGKGIARRLDAACPAPGTPDDDRRAIRRLRWYDYLLIIGLSVLGALAFNLSSPKGIPLFPKGFADQSVSRVTPAAAFEEAQQGKAILVDARSPESYEQEHVAGAESLPLTVFDFMYDLNLGKVDKAKEIVVYGRTISRLYDEEVAQKLVARGHRDVQIMTGGLEAWKKKGYPVAP